MTEEIIMFNESDVESLEEAIKRLEQERDELLEEIKQLHNGRRTEELYTLFGKPIKYWEELEQENKALKDNNNHLQAIIDDGRAENKRFREENKELKEKLDKEEYNACCECTNIQNQNDNYRSALEEIRKIINGHASPSECDYYGSYKNACEPCALRILKQTEGKIIDKINEVLQ